MKRVLFVCLGNICRSPAAEGVFLEMVRKAGLSKEIEVDSAGTGGWHVGDSPDARMTLHAKKRGYDLSSLEARQFQPQDLNDFDYILTMDNSNYHNVIKLDASKVNHHKVKPLTTFCKIHEIAEVPDPYYKAEEGFEHVMDLIEDACAELLEQIKRDLK